MALSVAVLDCLIAFRSAQLGLSDLLHLRAACKTFRTKLAGSMPPYLTYMQPRSHDGLKRAVSFSLSTQHSTVPDG